MMETYFSGEKYFTLLFVLLNLTIQNYIFQSLYFSFSWKNFSRNDFVKYFFLNPIQSILLQIQFCFFIFINFMIFF